MGGREIDTNFLESEEFKRLEEEYKFLTHARERLAPSAGELERAPYIVVDNETTGLSPTENEIIEIGAIKAEGGEIKDIFNKLVKPKNALPPEITNLTGISDEMLIDAPMIEDVLPEFMSFVGSGTLVAHNADFDVPFLNEAIRRSLGKEMKNDIICTLRTARAILPKLENHKLHTVANYFKVPLSARHRAIGDCEATYQVWLKLIEKLKGKNINTKAELAKFLKEAEAAKVPF